MSPESIPGFSGEKVDEFLFHKAAGRPIVGLSKNLDMPELSQVAETFEVNMTRVSAISSITPELLRNCFTSIVNLVNAQIKITGSLSCSGVDESQKKELADELARLDAISRQCMDDAKHIGYAFLKEHHQYPGLVRSGIEAILAAQVILSWASFETLAKDLWATCINARPRSIALIILTSKKGAAKDRPKSISFQTIAKYGLNLQDKVGTVLLDEEKYDFTSLRGIRLAYEDAFCVALANDLEKMNQLVFSSQELRVASAYRHVLMHNGGMVDDDFRDDVKGLTLYGVDELANGSYVKLTGEITGSISEAIILQGAILLTLVKTVMIENKD